MDLFLLSGLIGFLSLDISIAFQILISSPIFACALLGWLLGDVWLGFELGFLFQLLWLGRMPVGAHIVPEGNIATMIAASLILLLNPAEFPNTTLAVVFIVAILVSYLGAVFTILYRKFNGRILKLMLREVERIHFKIMILLEMGSMLIYMLGVFILTYIALKAGLALIPDVVLKIGPDLESPFSIVKPLIVGIGLASIYPILKEALGKYPWRKFEQ